MPEFLTGALETGPVLTWEKVAVRLIAALVLGRLVSLVYLWTRPTSERTPAFPTTLVLLTVLIAMATQVIGDNVGRAFTLVGALSIVRFRTVVRDTEDTAFVIFAVIVGMAVGLNNVPVALSGIVVVTAAALWMKPRQLAGAVGAEFVITLRVGIGQSLETLIGPIFEQYASDRRLLSVTTVKQGLSMSAAYLLRLRAGKSPDDLVRTLNGIEGIQDVALAAPRNGDED